MTELDIKIPDHIRSIAQTLTDAGFSCYLVGGSIRDILADLKATDYDLATDATPEEVMGLFERTVPTGIKFGTVTVLMGEESVEVTTFRLESDYLDRRHPETVKYSTSIHEDLSRRDFTFNAIAYEVLTGELVDPWLGQEDLAAGRLRAVGAATERLQEDPLRIIRAFRFMSFGEMDRNLKKAIVEHSHLLKAISTERIMTEFKKALATERAHEFFLEMHKFGTLQVIIPQLYREVPSDEGADWPAGFLDLDPDQRVESACEIMSHLKGESSMVKVAALMSAMLATETKQVSRVLKGLKFSNSDIDEVGAVLFNASSVLEMENDGQRRWFVYEMSDNLEGACALAVAERGLTLEDEDQPEVQKALLAMNMHVQCLDPLVTGHDIMEWLGIDTGKRVGTIKNELHGWQVCNDISDREKMLNELKKRYPK